MPARQRYFPIPVASQIPWLKNFRIKLSQRFAELGYTAADVADVLAAADRASYLLETVSSAAKQFSQSMTSTIKQELYGAVSNNPVTLPVFLLPTVPAAPPSVGSGALRLLFNFVKNIKSRPAYTPAIGEDLGIIGADPGEEDPDAVPPLGKIVVRGGEVIIPFTKLGHLGVHAECSEDGGPWEFLAIDTRTPFNDARAVPAGKTAVKRRYRLCFWDGTPTLVWAVTDEIVFGG